MRTRRLAELGLVLDSFSLAFLDKGRYERTQRCFWVGMSRKVSRGSGNPLAAICRWVRRHLAGFENAMD